MILPFEPCITLQSKIMTLPGLPVAVTIPPSATIWLRLSSSESTEICGAKEKDYGALQSGCLEVEFSNQLAHRLPDSAALDYFIDHINEFIVTINYRVDSLVARLRI